MANMTKAEAVDTLGGVAHELEALRASLELPVGAHLPITPAVLERLALARDQLRDLADSVSALEPDQGRIEVDPGSEIPGEVGMRPDEADGGTPVELREPGIPGVTEVQREALAAAGFITVADIRNASDEQLKAVPGIGDATVEKLREAMKA